MVDSSLPCSSWTGWIWAKTQTWSESRIRDAASKSAFTFEDGLAGGVLKWWTSWACLRNVIMFLTFWQLRMTDFHESLPLILGTSALKIRRTLFCLGNASFLCLLYHYSNNSRCCWSTESKSSRHSYPCLWRCPSVYRLSIGWLIDPR